MISFICDTCGQEINIYEGVVSWLKEEGELSNFRITHRNDSERHCEVKSCNEYKELYQVTSLSGYMSFIRYLLGCWEKGYTIKDFESLKRIIRLLSAYINEKLVSLVGE